MKGSLRLLLPAGLVVLTGLACSKPQPIVPKKPVASGSVLMYFTKKVTGPMELTIGTEELFIQIEDALVGMAPGEKKTVALDITPDSLAFYDIDMKFVVEPGDFEIMAGKSSHEGQSRSA